MQQVCYAKRRRGWIPPLGCPTVNRTCERSGRIVLAVIRAVLITVILS